MYLIIGFKFKHSNWTKYLLIQNTESKTNHSQTPISLLLQTKIRVKPAFGITVENDL